MTELRRLASGPLPAAAAALAFALSLAGGIPRVEAQPAKAAPEHNAKNDLKAQAAAAARQAYDAGLKEFAKGKFKPAADQLSTAIKAGTLTNAEMAKALYTRGLAYKKQDRPGLAISDLTSALWLKNGLGDDDRKKATAERSEAYKMAGLQDTGDGVERAVVANPNTAANSNAAANGGANSSSAGLSAAAVAQSAASHAENAANPSGPITRQDANSEAAKDAARARAAYGADKGNGLQDVAASTVVGSGKQSDSTTIITVEPSHGPMSSVTGFFSNLFSSKPPAPAEAKPQPAAVTTASTSPVAPEISSWSSATVVDSAHSEPPAPPKAAPQHARTAAVVPVHKAKPTGKYKVHIAALRSREDAEALVKKLVAQHGADLENHEPTVDKAVIGSMGTFYRVRIGGYASADEPRSLCDKLRTSGFDCLVVTN